MNLNTKLFLLFATFAIVPPALLGLLTYRSSRALIETQTIHHLVSTNLLKQAEINRWVQDNTRLLESLAGTLRLMRHVEKGWLKDPPGKDGHGTVRDTIRQFYLLPIISAGGFFELQMLRGNDGMVLVSTDRLAEEKYLDQQPFFRHGLSKTYVQTVYYSMTLQQPAMTISTPIRDSSGTVWGVLAGRLDLSELSRIMAQSSGLSRSEDTYIVNKFNFFITEPRFGRGYALKKSTHTEGVQAALGRNHGVGLYKDYQGIPVVGAYRWLPQWKVALLTEIRQDEAFAPVFLLQQTTGGLCAATFLLAIGASWYCARRITLPLRHLVAGAERIGQGDLAFSAESASSDEIGELSRAFERMTRKLKSTLVSRDALEKQVRVRIAAETRLKETLTDLKRSNLELEQFAYVASHDLQEPLRMVSSYTQLLGERYSGQLDEKAHKFIHYAVDGATRMQRLIQDLLTFSRVTTRGRAFEPVDSRAVLDQTLENLRSALNGSGATVTQGDLPTVQADPIQLGQLFQNLIGNAIKFQVATPPKIHVAAAAEADQWVFSVCDNGIGIDPKYAGKIFTIFQRLHTSSEYPGTGIGLAICQRIVQRHGGQIWFEPGPTGGTIFNFTLPRRPVKSTEHRTGEGLSTP